MRNVLTRMMNESYFNDDIGGAELSMIASMLTTPQTLERAWVDFLRSSRQETSLQMEPLSNRFSSTNTNKQTQIQRQTWGTNNKYIFSYKCHHLQSAFLWQRQIQITSSNYSTLMKLKSNYISGDFGWKAYSDHPSIWIPQHPILPQSKQLDRKVIFYIYVAQYV